MPTASATRKLRRNLKKTLFMSGMRTTPSRESRLMIVMEMNPPTQAATHETKHLKQNFKLRQRKNIGQIRPSPYLS